MAIQITAVRLSGGGSHEHIVHLWWTSSDDNSTGDSTREQVVTFIEGGGSAFVADASRHRVSVGVVTPAHGSKYLRTYADGVWTDNLLALPRR